MRGQLLPCIPCECFDVLSEFTFEQRKNNIRLPRDIKGKIHKGIFTERDIFKDLEIASQDI